jgi:hypothetical protein
VGINEQFLKLFPLHQTILSVGSIKFRYFRTLLNKAGKHWMLFLET